MEEENVQQPGEQQAQPQVSAVQIKLPPFWPKDPTLWFAQIEAQFGTCGVTVSKTKFDHVVSCLDPEFATEVRDLLLNPPAEEPYETLKAQLTKRTSASEQRRLQELLSTEELGDRTPSQMLRRIQQLLGDMAPRVDATLLRELFLQRLPSNIRMVLTPSAGALDLDQLAQLADRILEASPPAISAATADKPNTITTTQLAAQVAQLTERLDKLTSQMTKTINQMKGYRRQSRSRSPGRFNNRRQSSSQTEQEDGICYYHQKFRDSPTSASPPASGRETTRPLAFGDERCWPLT